MAGNFLLTVKATGAYPGMLLERTLHVGLPAATFVIGMLALAGLAVILGSWILVRNRGIWPAIYRSRVVRMTLAAAFVLLLLLSVWPRGYSLKRHLVISLPFICLVAAWFWPMAGRMSRTLSILLVLSAIASLANVIAIPKDDWKTTAAFLQGAYREGDSIWIAPGYDSIPFEYYNRGRLPVTQIDSLQASSDALASTRGRIWLVYNDTPTMLVDTGPKLEADLANRLHRGQEWSAYRIRAALFVPH